MDELRLQDRVQITDYQSAEMRIGDIRFVVDQNEMIRGHALDITVNGIGVVIPDVQKETADELDRLRNFSMRIFLGKEAILVAVTKVWQKLLTVDGKMVLKGGMKFHMISTDDRLKLTTFLKKIRGYKLE